MGNSTDQQTSQSLAANLSGLFDEEIFQDAAPIDK